MKENYDTFSPPVYFKVEDYLDTDEDVLTSEIQALTDAEIIAQVTQSADINATDVAEEEEDGADMVITPPIEVEIRNAHNEGEEMRKKITMLRSRKGVVSVANFYTKA